jgi:YVTN family beta-propeller protein
MRDAIGNPYITNEGSDTVSVISLATQSVGATIKVGKSPWAWR